MNNSDPSGDSASGCTGYGLLSSISSGGTCITIVGQLNLVYTISTSSNSYSAGCSVAEVTINGQVKFRAPEVCYSAETMLSASWGTSQTWSHGTPSGQFIQTANGSTPFKNNDVVCAQYVGTGFGSPNANGISDIPCETIKGNSGFPYKSLPTAPQLPNPLSQRSAGQGARPTTGLGEESVCQTSGNCSNGSAPNLPGLGGGGTDENGSNGFGLSSDVCPVPNDAEVV